MADVLYNRIQDGEFESKVEVLQKPRKPLLLSKSAGDLTPAEVASISSVKAEYEDALNAWRASCDASRRDEYECVNRFRVALLAEFDIPDNKMGGMLYSLAWDQGHSSGYSNVLSCFQDLTPIYDEYRHVLKELKEAQKKIDNFKELESLRMKQGAEAIAEQQRRNRPTSTQADRPVVNDR